MLQILISILLLLTAVPIGIILYKLTKDEAKTYNKYIPSILWIIAILAAIYFTLNLTIAFTLTSMFIIFITYYLNGKSNNGKPRKNKTSKTKS